MKGYEKKGTIRSDLIKEFDRNQESLGFSQNQGDFKYMINGMQYINNFIYKKNDKLKEYYTTVKHGLKRMGCDLISNKNLFNDKNYSKIIMKIDKLLP